MLSSLLSLNSPLPSPVVVEEAEQLPHEVHGEVLVAVGVEDAEADLLGITTGFQLPPSGGFAAAPAAPWGFGGSLLSGVA